MKLKTISLALLAGALATQAFAHATFETKEAPAGSYYKAVVRIGHGCDGQATQKVKVTIPEGIVSVKPMPKAGWEVTTIVGDYANTYDVHGSAVKSGVTEIEWAGNLPDTYYDEFTFQALLTDKLPVGETVYVPVVQECASAENAWIEIPAKDQNAHDLKRPAPGIMITAAAGSHDHAAAGPIKAGDLEITMPYARATAANAPVGGGYTTIHNTGSKADRLIGGSADFAGKVEIHEMVMDNDVMKMRPLADGLEIPAGGTVTLKPGSYHIMFMKLKEQLAAGETRNVTLQFENAGEVTLPFSVQEIGAMDHGAMDHSGHSAN